MTLNFLTRYLWSGEGWPAYTQQHVAHGGCCDGQRAALDSCAMSLSDKGHPPQGKLGTGSLRAPWLPGKVCNCPAGVRKTLPIIPFLTPRADTPAQHPGSSQHPNPCTAPKTPHGVPRLHTAPEIPRNTSQTTFNIRDLTQHPRPAQHPGSGGGPAGWEADSGPVAGMAQGLSRHQSARGSSGPWGKAMGREAGSCKLCPHSDPL